MRWDWRPPVGFLAGTVAAWAAGLTLATSALLGLLVAAGVLLLTRLDGTPDPGWDRDPGLRPCHGSVSCPCAGASLTLE